MNSINNVNSGLRQPANAGTDPYKEFVDEIMPFFFQMRDIRGHGLHPRVTLLCDDQIIGSFQGTEARETIFSELEQMARKCPNPNQLTYAHKNVRSIFEGK